jgi:hypothetical protein
MHLSNTGLQDNIEQIDSHPLGSCDFNKQSDLFRIVVKRRKQNRTLICFSYFKLIQGNVIY